MLINCKRIIAIDKYLDCFSNADNVYVCVEKNSDIIKKVRARGINNKFIVGSKFIPNSIGKITDFNINGKFIVRKDKPKVTCTFERYYHNIDWHGNEHYGICFQSR